MKVEDAIETLKRRVQVDRNIRENRAETDYEKFCENECIAIETILSAYEEEKEKNNELDEKFRYAVPDDMISELYISKNKLREFFIDKIRYRQFELQQEYKDFKDDIELNTIQNIKQQLLEEE